MYVGFIFIVALSLAFQVMAALLAMRLIRITGTNRAWMVIAVAILAMAVRRLTVLAGVLRDPSVLDPTEFWSEAIGLFNTVLLLIGLAAIVPLFRTIQRAKETTQQARDQLEVEVRQRTADLAGARERLQVELAERTNAEAASATSIAISARCWRCASAISNCWPMRSTMVLCNRPRRP